MSLQDIKQEDRIIGGAAIVLSISLLFFPFYSVSFGPITATSSMTGSPDSWLGVIALLLTVALIADLAIERFSPTTHLPVIGSGRENTRFVLAAAVAACVVLKFVLHLHFSWFGWGFYATVLLAGGLVYVTRKAVAGGVSLGR
jgi:hypothetical protein